MGPLVLVALSAVVASFESRAERREVFLAGMEHAPGLVNFLQRQTWVVNAAPADYEARLRASTFGDPVVVVPVDFEAAMLLAMTGFVSTVAFCRYMLRGDVIE
jgi:sodium transport system permease protein